MTHASHPGHLAFIGGGNMARSLIGGLDAQGRDPSTIRVAEPVDAVRDALVRDFGVPPEAIFIDPHARHTTTNLRNASRLVLRYGLPGDRTLLITTDQSQSAYISGKEFHDRCVRELGYQPGVVGKRLSPFDLEFVVSAASLHADSRDPLDP